MNNKQPILTQEMNSSGVAKHDTSQEIAATVTAGVNPPDEKQAKTSSQELTPEQRRMLIGLVIGGLLLLIVSIASVVWLAQPSTDTARVRDIFIIFMALASLLTTFVLIILLIQLARLINLLQNELRPLLDSLNIAISNLRGTTVFLSDNLTEPVIKMNEYLAGLSQLLSVLGLMRRKNKPNKKKESEI
jgi:hypothetical protein